MNIMKPVIPEERIRIKDFVSYAQGYIYEEIPMSRIEICDEQVEHSDFSKIEIQNSVLKNCTFLDCIFEKASFIDIIFEGCDLSNSQFADAYFERCYFVSCKCIGVDMRGTIFKNIRMVESNLQYSYFNKARLDNTRFEMTDFTEAAITEVKIKKFEADKSKFYKNNFYKTILAGIDFTENEFVAPTVSSPPEELKGIKINKMQAADLVSLWGIIIKE